MSSSSKIGDLTQIVGPITEDNIIRYLNSRFQKEKFETKLGTNIISINPFTLDTAEGSLPGKAITTIVQHVLSQHHDTGHSQVFVLSGETGSGKTFQCDQILECIRNENCNKERDDQLTAAMTVMRAFGSASTLYNPHSSRMGVYVELMTSDCKIYRNKIHCLFLDQRRINTVPIGEQNFHIFYQLLSGLTQEERVKLHLEDYDFNDLNYLSTGNDIEHDKKYYHDRFLEWKKSLSSLDIPVMDVLRILSTVLLLGNIKFQDGGNTDLEISGQSEMKSASALLGISSVAMYRGLTSRSHTADGQMCHTSVESQQANHNCATLARALYFRTVSAILKRVNSLKKANLQGSHSSFESLQSQNSSSYNLRPDILSLSQGSHGHGRKFTDGFIGILDLPGFENYEVNNLEKLCRNLCAEKVHHHFIKHTFITPEEILRDECVSPDIDIRYTNNSQVIDLLYSQPNGIMPLLSRRNSTSQIKKEHRTNNYFFEPLPKSDSTFGVRHFGGRANYNAEDFGETNQDQLSDDVIAMFSKRSCNFGFASHLFSSELKQISSKSKGITGSKYRTMPSCHQDEISEMDNKGILSYDFPLRMDAILKSTSHAKPHYIHCLKSNDSFKENVFDCETILRQIHSIQLQETVQLMVEGLPYRMKYRIFNQRYKLFMLYRLSHKPDSLPDETKEILECFLRRMDKSNQPYTTTQWIYGRKHIFYSESSRQCFDRMKLDMTSKAATVIQSYWRGYWARRSWSMRKKSKGYLNRRRGSSKKRYSGIKEQPPPAAVQAFEEDEIPIYENHPIAETGNPLSDYVNKLIATLPSNPPPLPKLRSYTIHNNRKCPFPQRRRFNEKFKVANYEGLVFDKGQDVTVTGISSKPKFLIVQYCNKEYHIPYHLLTINIPDLMVSPVL
ncbi:hypothetical protein LOTGIDRAFT_215365 [Lottia gigantea]|uniref:Myosin motor domain-containing protein n=1 Tax=Lottia gigantea TaxID=225164 RepID=V4ADC5_LOTGI|nr:hypothetical protein LOTGIDRAFT_215365 [Lottia gigantea]ESO94837.1 hypothetical protein LOTGIDRAFT_215365 [Lottia gigantea]